MSVSSEIKSYLECEVSRDECCEKAFEAGKSGQAFTETCPGCRASYIAGVFTAYGTVTDPSKSFHLDIKAPRDTARRTAGLLEEEGLTPGACSMKNGKIRLYYKVSSAISDFLTYIGAAKYALTVMEAEVIKDVRCEETRKANAELANIDRAATAAAEEIRVISILKKHGALNSLPDELRQTAAAREKYPFMPLGELCLQFSPPISKSGLSHRFKRLAEEADRLCKKP